MTSKLQNLIIILGFLIVAGLGYYLYVQNSNGSLRLSNKSISTQAAAESAEFLQKLNSLKEVSLDGSLFSDSRFQSLVNNRRPVIQENVGRPNPFLDVND